MQNPIMYDFNKGFRDAFAAQMKSSQQAMSAMVGDTFKIIEDFNMVFKEELRASIPTFQLPEITFQNSQLEFIRLQKELIRNITQPIREIMSNATSLSHCFELYENQNDEINYTFADDILLNNTLSETKTFVVDRFPSDISIAQMEAVLDIDSDSEVEDLTDDQISYVQSLYEKDFAKIKHVTDIEEFVVLFDRMNVLTDIIPGYQAKFEFYQFIISHLLNGLDSAFGTLVYIFIMFIIHQILKHFQLYNKFLDIIKNFKDDNPLI